MSSAKSLLFYLGLKVLMKSDTLSLKQPFHIEPYLYFAGTCGFSEYMYRPLTSVNYI